jgi:FkbH-like protein
VIRIHRNHAFELVASAMQPYLAYTGWNGDFRYGDYDDSLSFGGVSDGPPADAEVVWLDFGRYGQRHDPAGLAQWMAGRLRSLRTLSPAPILVLGWGGGSPERSFNAALAEALGGLPGARLCDPGPIADTVGDRFYDDRAAPLSGTRLSDAVCVLLARELACRWLPASLRPRIKALALDLDQTLYRGVLGEDGPEGVELTHGHTELQRRLVELQSEGLFLALVSRNRPEDVERLFAARPDFPLRWEHFSARAIGWGDKALGIEQVAGSLRIGIDAIAFIDDNPGELAAVATRWPGLHTIHAEEDAEATRRLLDWYPGLWAWSVGEADALRVADLGAAAERAREMEASADPREYLESLQVRLDFAANPRAQLGRLVELSQKTNQFNLNLGRIGEVDMAGRLGDRVRRVVSIRLRDRLADSGIIGLICGRREGDALVIDELCISCRALGRNLEDLMVGEAIRWMLEELPADRVEFEHQSGPRNEPARQWQARLLGRPLAGEHGREAAPSARWTADRSDLPVEINRESPDAA